MFNGIIYNQGIVTKIIKRPKGLNIFVKSDFKLSNKDIGLSVACDGVCLTLISYKAKIMEFYLSCLLYTSPSPRDRTRSRMPSSA